VRDAVREAGFPKPRIEGEDNGEWIIVDCGAAVAHIMQPAIRQYYHLEEIWGDKPVRLKFGAPNPMGLPMKEPSKAAKAPGKKEAEPKTTLRRSSAAKTAIKAAEQAAKPKPRPKAPAKRPGAKTAIKSAIKTVVVGKKTAASKPAAPRSGAKTSAKPAAQAIRTQEGARPQGMKLYVVAVGQRVPDWAQTAWDDYAKRFPPELRVELKAVKTEPRGSKTLETLYAAERERIEAAIPRGCRVVALDERGTTLTTVALAAKLKSWQLEADDVALVIGGPDGLDPAFRQAAHERIRLSDLTLPHAMVRVLLVEQLYRAWSINANHPYHRE
jgi:23S rRNA (pseudouridine1915-N3)-methyltransferase